MARFVVTPPVPNELIVTTAGPQGPKGNDGISFNIKGTYAGANQLPGIATNGDAYIVGTDLYIRVNDAWTNAGPFRGPKGEAGTNGVNGVNGQDGRNGVDGKAASVRVGTTRTVINGTQANVVNTGTTSDAVLDFDIPEGPRGAQGSPGSSGAFHQSVQGAPYIKTEGQIYIGVEFPTNFPDGSLFFKKV